MISAPWQGLLADLGIIAIMIAAWSIGFEWKANLSPSVRQGGTILAAGSCALILMSLPFALGPGLFVDLRAVPIALSGFFAGPLVGGAVGIVSALYRAYVGGIGAGPGIIAIGAMTFLGMVAWLAIGGRTPTHRQVLVFAAIVAPLSVIWTLFLPDEMRWGVIEGVVIPSIVINFLAMVLAGSAVVSQLRHRATAAENALHRSLMDAFPEPLNAKNFAGRFIAANPATAALMQAEGAAALIGKTDFDFYPADVAHVFRKDEEAVLASGRMSIIEQRIEHADGSSRWISTLKVPLVDARGATLALLTHNRDISELKRLRDTHEETARRLDDALTHMADALVVYDKDDILTMCNEQYRSMFPKTAHLRVPGARFADILRASIACGEELIPPDHDADTWLDALHRSLRRGGETSIALADGRFLHARVRIGSEGSALVVISDVTRQKIAERHLAEMNRQLRDLARVDGLTGVANRRTFDETLATELKRSQRTGAPLSLLLLDLDFFKGFNDARGHVAGDDCLRKVSDEMRLTVSRAGDLLARYGGEEFAVVLPATDSAQAVIVAERLRQRIKALGIGHPGSPHGAVTISIGLATSRPGARQTPRDLVRCADIALYAAKGAGRNTVCRTLSADGDVEVVSERAMS